MALLRHIGIDVDGVLRDLATPLIQVFEREHPRLAGRHVPVEQWPAWSGFEQYFPPGVDLAALTAAHLEEIWVGAPAYPDVAAFVAGVPREWVIHIVTTQLSDVTAGYTREWLDRHGIRVPDDRFHVTARKGEVPIDLLLDDVAGNLEAARENGIVPVCRDRPWNGDWTGLRIAALPDLFPLVTRIEAG